MSDQNKLKEELGIGSKAEQEITSRLMNHEGYFNVHKTGLTFGNALDVYNALILMPAMKFYPFVIGSFVGVNFVFALGFLLLGRNSINGSKALHSWEFLGDAFFMCVQTFATIGYGVLSPNGIAANVLSVAVAFFGIMMGALATGLIFARFSRPTAKIMFSDNALIAPFKEGKALMLRVSNLRKSQLIDVGVRILLAIMEGEGAHKVRRFHRLNIEYDKIMFMPQHWTIVHEINEESPLWHLNESKFIEGQCEIIVLLTATDDVFSQAVHARNSYYQDEVVWNAKFKNMFTDPIDGKITIDLQRLSQWEKA